MRRLVLAGAMVLAACSARGGSEGEDKDAISNRVGDWEATLSAVNNSGVRGSAGVQSVGLGSGARISIEGAAPGAQHPWHVHAGRCGSGGAVIGSASAYRVLQVGTDGRASATATLDVALRENETYHVNVHRSTTDMGTIIACGNLSND